MSSHTIAERTADLRRSRAARSQRQQLTKFAVGLLVAVLLPSLLRSLGGSGPGWSLENATAGTALALVLGFFGFRSFANFPGVRGGSYILPAFTISYGLVLVVFFFLRIDYSRAQFLSSFIAAIIWYNVDYFFFSRKIQPVIGVVPIGEATALTQIGNVRWRRLTISGENSVGCDSIAADLGASIPDDWERYLADHAVAGVPVLHYKQLQESLTGTVQIDHLAENHLGSLIPERVYIRFKSIVDTFAALIAGIILLPALATIGILIRLDSPGPSLYRQQRVGFRGRRFTVYKFRTMKHRGPDASQQRQDAITAPNDRRVTAVGAVLRRYRLDELPQIWNILCGQMSWIGPRPEAVILSQWYEGEIPFYRYRHIVRPGITGWAQVNQGHVADVSEVSYKLRYDFYYIKYFSPWLDLLILLRTAKTVLTGFGAR